MEIAGLNAEQQPEMVSTTPNITPLNTTLFTPPSTTIYTVPSDLRQESNIDKCNKILHAIQHVLARYTATKTEQIEFLWTKAIATATQAELPRLTILVSGESGHGKTALINALLGEKELIPTSGSHACTAVMTMISYNHEDGKKFRASVMFLSKEEWRQEVVAYLRDLRNISAKKLPSGEDDSPQAIAVSRLEAVYPALRGKTPAELSKLSVDDLMDDDAVKEVLDNTIPLRASTAHELCSGYSRYVKSAHRTGDPTLEHWPLVKKVCIYVRHDTLKTGAIIIDAPGWNDASQGRQAVADRALREAKCIFVVADAVRGATNKNATSFLTQQGIAQHSRDAKLDNLVFVCTKTDVIDVTETRREYQDDGEFTESLAPYEKIIDKNDHAFDENDKKIHALKEEVAGCKSRKAALDKEKKCLTPQKTQAQKDLKEIREKSQVRKRAADSDSTDTRPSKRAREDAQQTSPGTFEDEDSDWVVDVHTDEDDAYEDVSIDAQQIVSSNLPGNTQQNVEALKQRINELTALIKPYAEETKKEDTRKKDLEREILELEQEKHEFSEAITKAENKIRVLCIQQRNKAFEPSIRARFESIMQKVIQGDDDDDDGEGDDDVPDTEMPTLPKLPIFCVSSTGYQSFGNQTNVSLNKLMPFTSRLETGIPSLQTFISTKALQQRTDAEAVQFADLVRLLTSIHMWTMAGGKRIKQEGSHGPVSSLPVFTKEIRERVVTFTHQFPTDIADGVKRQLSRFRNKGSQRAIVAIQKWFTAKEHGGHGYAATSIKAAVKRDGDYGNKTTQFHFNQDFIASFMRRTSPGWTDIFSREVPNSHQEIRKEVTLIVERFNRGMPIIARNLGLTLTESNNCTTHFTAVTNTIKRCVTDFEVVVQDQQRRISRTVEAYIKDDLKPLYRDLEEIKGSGCKVKMESHVLKELSVEKARQYIDHAVQQVANDFWTSLSEPARLLEEEVDDLCGEFDAAMGIVLKKSDGAFGSLPDEYQVEIENLLAQASELSLIDTSKIRDLDPGNADNRVEGAVKDERSGEGRDINVTDAGHGVERAVRVERFGDGQDIDVKDESMMEHAMVFKQAVPVKAEPEDGS